MGLLLGSTSTTENEKRIEELEDKLQDKNTEIMHMGKRIGDLEDDIQNAHEKARNAIVNAHGGDLRYVDNRDDVVETLDEPKLAWKATKNCILKVIIPAGEDVVHPTFDHAPSGKKRVSAVIPIEFYEVKDDSMGMVTTTKNTTTLYGYSSYAFADGFKYTIGERITPDNGFDTRTDAGCGPGIHVFPNKFDAIDWYDH